MLHIKTHSYEITCSNLKKYTLLGVFHLDCLQHSSTNVGRERTYEMSEKNQEAIGLPVYPSAPEAYHQVGYPAPEGQHSEKYPAQSPPPPYASTTPQGQQYGQYPQGYSHPQGYAQPPPPQGYSHASGYQPVPQGYAQQGYPQTQHYGNQPMYGGQGQTVVVAQPVPSTMIVTTAQPRPSNWLIPAILACLCCFWPTGICAIVAACNANSAADSGNMQSAEQSARTARNLTILTVVLGVICVVIIIVLRVVVHSTSQHHYYK